MPFVPAVRKYIFWRDKGICQTCGCSFDDGFNMQASHYPDKHVPYWDNNPENGRLECTLCHVRSEISRGNTIGAKKLYESQTVLTFQDILRRGGRVIPNPTPEHIRIAHKKYGKEVVTLLRQGKKVTYLIVGDIKPDWHELI